MTTPGSAQAGGAEALPAVAGLRVVVVLCGFALGGAERQAVLLARELARRGASVQVWGLFPPDAGPTSELCDRFGLPWRALRLDWDRGMVRDVVSLVHLARSLRRARPDLILPYTIYPNVLCGAIWKLTPAALCIWNQREEGIYRMDAQFERWAVRQTPRFVSNSTAGARFLATTMKVDPARIAIVPNGVELETPLESRSEWRSRLGLESGAFVVAMVANLHRNKDHSTLLRAWRLVVDRTPGPPVPALLLAGRLDNAADDVKALTAEMNLGETVRILGQVRDVSGLLHASDLMVLSSRYEGVPNSVLEAMGAGLPVVATDIPGVREAIGEEGIGYLAPPGDHERLANRILEMVSSPETRKLAGERNRRRAAQCFGVQQMVQKYLDVVRSGMAVEDRR